MVQFRRGVMSIFCPGRIEGVMELTGPTPPDTLTSEERLNGRIRRARLAAGLGTQNSTPYSSNPSLAAAK